jgi:glutamine synthetase
MTKEAPAVTESVGDVLNLIRDNEVQIVDLRFADLPGLMQHF